MDIIPIFKSDVDNRASFELLLSLYDCRIGFVEDKYYMVEGSPENIEDFRNYWNAKGELE